MRMLMLTLAVVLVGCATEGKFRDHLDAWIGQNADQFVVRMGPPQSETTLSGGSKLMEWRSTAGAMAYSPYGMRNIAMATSIYCNIRLVVDDANIIRQYSYEGNNCTSK